MNFIKFRTPEGPLYLDLDVTDIRHIIKKKEGFILKTTKDELYLIKDSETEIDTKLYQANS